MEEKNLTNQESLDLIRKMLLQTRVQMQEHSNKTEMWIGILGILVASSVYIGIQLTHSPYINLLWLLMYLSFYIAQYFKKRSPQAHTYISKVINTAFSLVGWTFGIACMACAIFLFQSQNGIAFAILFPLSFIIMSFVTLLKGLLLEEKIYQFTSYLVMFMGFYLMVDLFITRSLHRYWILGYAITCFFLFVLPNLIFNCKMKTKQ